MKFEIKVPRNQVAEYLAAGYSDVDIAKKMNVHRITVGRIKKQLKKRYEETH
jgi:transposase